MMPPWACAGGPTKRRCRRKRQRKRSRFLSRTNFSRSPASLAGPHPKQWLVICCFLTSWPGTRSCRGMYLRMRQSAERCKWGCDAIRYSLFAASLFAKQKEAIAYLRRAWQTGGQYLAILPQRWSRGALCRTVFPNSEERMAKSELANSGLQNSCGLFGVPESMLICSSVWRRAYQQGFTPNCGNMELEQFTSWSPAGRSIVLGPVHS